MCGPKGSGSWGLSSGSFLPVVAVFKEEFFQMQTSLNAFSHTQVKQSHRFPLGL